MYSLFETAGCLEQFSQSVRICVRVCVCALLCLFQAKLIFGGCESHPSSALGEAKSKAGMALGSRTASQACGVGASCYVDVER